MKINIVSEGFIGQHHAQQGSGKSVFFGGAEVYLYNLCKELIREGHEVRVIQAGDAEEEFEFENIRVSKIKLKEYKFLSFMGISRRFHYFNFFWRKKIDPDADIVHFHYFYNAFPFASKNMTGTCHGIEWDSPDYKQPLWKNGIKDGLKKCRERFHHRLIRFYAIKSIKRLKVVVANDWYFKRYVESEYPQYRDKVVYIPNAVDTKKFHDGVAPDKEILRKHEGKIKILFPKNMARARGTHLAIEALTLLKNQNVVLLLAGYIHTEFKELAERLGVLEKIEFLGHKNNQTEMPGIYRASDIIIIPSTCREATAISMLEGMACGKPVIVSNIGGLTDVVIDDFNGKLIYPQSNELANAIDDLIEDTDKRIRISRKGAEWVHEFYTLDKWTAKYIKLFNTVLKK